MIIDYCNVNFRCRLLCCCVLGDEQSKDAFDEISKLLADFFQVWPLPDFSTAGKHNAPNDWFQENLYRKDWYSLEFIWKDFVYMYFRILVFKSLLNNVVKRYVIFQDLDLVPTDIAAGLILVQKDQDKLSSTGGRSYNTFTELTTK